MRMHVPPPAPVMVDTAVARVAYGAPICPVPVESFPVVATKTNFDVSQTMVNV